MDDLIRKQDALDAFNGNVTISAPRNAGRVYTYLKMVTDRIKALPPVYVPDTNVGDMISRRTAMKRLMAQNVIMDGSEYHNGFNAGVNRAQEVIRNLPPVQSDVPVINVGDMISRQAATTIPVMPKEHRHYQTNNLDDAYEQGWNDLQECIENLPSAQPERRYTVRELSVFRHGISLSLCSKKSAQRWHYDEDTAIEIEFLERLYEKVGEDMRGCKDADD